MTQSIEDRFHPQMTKATEDYLVESLSSASRVSYGYGGLDHLSELLHAIQSAFFLKNRDGLRVFLFATREAVKELSESNDSN